MFVDFENKITAVTKNSGKKNNRQGSSGSKEESTLRALDAETQLEGRVFTKQGKIQ